MGVFVEDSTWNSYPSFSSSDYASALGSQWSSAGRLSSSSLSLTDFRSVFFVANAKEVAIIVIVVLGFEGLSNVLARHIVFSKQKVMQHRWL